MVVALAAAEEVAAAAVEEEAMHRTPHLPEHSRAKGGQNDSQACKRGTRQSTIRSSPHNQRRKQMCSLRPPLHPSAWLPGPRNS